MAEDISEPVKCYECGTVMWDSVVGAFCPNLECRVIYDLRGKENGD